MKLLIIQLVVLVSWTAHLAYGDPFPWAENVCNTTIPIRKDITVDVPVKYDIKVQDMCGILPCMKTRTETKMDQSIRTIVKYVQQSTCCTGYTETPDRQCAPICLKSCNNGKCVAPNLCKCQPEPTESSPGFVGPSCSRFTCLSDNKWGSKCDRECNCSGNSYCSASTGKCLCWPGWKGENCSIECRSFDLESSCRDILELPPIVEPDANMMERDNSISMSSKLVAPAESLILEKEVPLDNEPSRSDITVYSLLALLSISIILCIILVAFIMKMKANNNRDDPYYATSSSRAPGDDSNYSASSYYSSSNPTTIRSTIPADFLSKNLSFASTTRNILMGIDTGKIQPNQDSNQHRQKILFAPKVESQLIESQKFSAENVYSEPKSSVNDKLLSCSSASPYNDPSPGDLSHISLDISTSSSKASTDDNHIYQVPRSPSCKSGDNTSHVGQKSMEDHEDGVSNIYEEIKPRGPGRV